jgi:sec-independent protein translocase protein TatB
MFEIGWTEMLVIAVVMIVVVGPKDLPNMLRTFGRTTAKLRAMAGDFQKQFNEALKEAELDDVKKSIDTLRDLNPANEIKKQLNPFEKAAADVRAGLDTLKPTPKPADPAAPAAEPLKNDATAMPGVSGPEAMPSATPVFPPMSDPAVKPADAPAAPAQQVDVAAAMTGTWKSAAASTPSLAATAEPAATVTAKPVTKAPRKKASAGAAAGVSRDVVKPATKTSAPAAKPAKPATKAASTKAAEPVAAVEKPAAAKTTRKKTTGPAA